MSSLNGPKRKFKHQTHLIKEKSPYLIQHAQNPVDWYPWSKEAFEKARRENKPVFLSIGYSTCHWCHVMAYESFQDPEVGDLMNQVFVSIKVDREERPDIDSIYMTVCQMMTGSGGWPLTIIMTPEKKPFFAGTYFPKESRTGGIGLKDLILNVRDLWAKNPTEVRDSAQQITQALKKMVVAPSGDELDANILDYAYKQLSESFDHRYGGFGDYQKFPSPSNLIFLLRYWRRTQNADALEIVEKTLQSMMQGGIYDHLGFGFHRYAVDQRWLVPHFEKMLYDQALISMAYIEAFQAFGEEKYRKTAEQIFEYVLRDMQSGEGGFYSAEDADSEGVEGKFYLWTREEIFQVLDEDEAEFTSKIYNLKDEGNYIEESTGKRSGSNILHLEKSLKDVAEEEGVSETFLESKMDKIRKNLFRIREARVHPGKDDKILVDWNGLMIAALSKGSQVFGEEKYLNAAIKAADFILNNMCQEGRFLHRYRDGEAAIMANLDDYAFLIWGLLELYQVTFQVKYLRSAILFNETLLNQFQDREGGFYFTPDDGEKVLMRKKDSYDSAIPSGNSVEMLNLLLLARITENPEMEKKALELERAFSDRIRRSPTAHTQLLLGVDFKLGPSYEVVIVGDRGDEDTRYMLEKLREHYAPNKVVLFKEAHKPDEITEIAESLKFKESIYGKPTAYVCVDGTCMMPTNDVNRILDLLG